MKIKAAFIVGAGIGFVVGARAGRRQFEVIKAQALTAWNSDTMQSTLSTVQEKASEVAKEQGAVLKDKIVDAVKTAMSHDETDEDLPTPRPTTPPTYDAHRYPTGGPNTGPVTRP